VITLIHKGAELISLSWRIFRLTLGAKYRKSFLGYFWMIAPAVLVSGGVTLANRAGVLNPGETTIPYPLFAFIGILSWMVFAEAIEVPRTAFEGARSYLTRVHFSRTAIILAQLYETLVVTSVRIVVVLALIAAFVGLSPSAAGIVLAAFTGCILLGLALGTVLVPFLLLFSDLHNTLRLFLTYGLFLTPALYQPQGNGAFATLVNLNPIAVMMTASREAAGGMMLSNPTLFWSVIAAGLLITLGGLVQVRATAPIIIERMLLGGR
jgi:lipopolysaccharide transport system permease protein